MIQLTSDEETSSGEHSLWLQRQSKTMFQSVMRQRSKLLLELLSGPSPNDFWFNLSKISHNDTSLFMFICLSKMMSQCANGCLCWWTILPRVSVPRGDSCHDGGHDEKHRCQPIRTVHFALLGCARRRWTLSSAMLFSPVWLLSEVWFRTSAEATFIKSET